MNCLSSSVDDCNYSKFTRKIADWKDSDGITFFLILIYVDFESDQSSRAFKLSRISFTITYKNKKHHADILKLTKILIL